MKKGVVIIELLSGLGEAVGTCRAPMQSALGTPLGRFWGGISATLQCKPGRSKDALCQQKGHDKEASNVSSCYLGYYINNTN